MTLKALVACEESQAVCKALRELGYEAYSCDIQECSGGHPEWHIKGDVLPLLNGNCEFETMDGHKRTCLWLKGLPKLVPTQIVEPIGYWVQRSGQRAKGFTGGHRDPKMRSKTFPGIAKAMAEQWGKYIEEDAVPVRVITEA